MRSLRFLRSIRTFFAVALAAGVVGCSSLTPIEKIVIAEDSEPLLAQIRAGEVGVNAQLPWGGVPGMKPSYFTPLCAAAFSGMAAAVGELLALGADPEIECSPAIRPHDLVVRHRSGPQVVAMRKMLQAREGRALRDADPVTQARL